MSMDQRYKREKCEVVFARYGYVTRAQITFVLVRFFLRNMYPPAKKSYWHYILCLILFCDIDWRWFQCIKLKDKFLYEAVMFRNRKKYHIEYDNMW